MKKKVITGIIFALTVLLSGCKEGSMLTDSEFSLVDVNGVSGPHYRFLLQAESRENVYCGGEQ